MGLPFAIAQVQHKESMMKRTNFAAASAAALAAVLGVAVAAPVEAATFGSNEIALSLGDEGKRLVVIAGEGAGSDVALRDPAGKSVRLDDIDFRPATGQLYGYSNQTDTVYLIDRVTGLATPQVSLKGATDTQNIGFDFNNVLDAARVVSGKEDNLVFNPKVDPATLTRATDLFYVTGDVNAGRNPNVGMNAYTNAVAGATTTVQYVIDTGLDVLAGLGNNAGTLTTVGQLYLGGSRFDATDLGGFDILSLTEGSNRALALLTMNVKGIGPSQAIYEFDLAPDAMGRINLTAIADLNGYRDRFDRLDGFAVMSLPSPVPVPAAGVMLLGGLAGLALVRRRRAT
jgi:hypothetical protein